MALRLRRDVQKASYYVWFLGAEEAKGLRGSRIINSVLPYLIDRSRGQEPLKVTLQVSHKGIKILQGSSKHFIPHSAITSSVQTDDIVACVLLLYNPATKCPLHVHAYRCDSESTAEALHQQLQILINRPENQRRFEELENRLGIMPPMATTASGNNAKSSSAGAAHSKTELNHKQHQQLHHQQQQKQQRRLETSPKRFSSSLGSDTGNSTRESECSEEHSGSPVSGSPPMLKPLQQQPPHELFDSLAAELRAKLNGNGPPILLPPRDYDTVHRSKGNLTAIELRRCRNKLIVGSTTSPTGTMLQNMTGTTTSATANANATTGVGGVGGAVKQISSRGSSGIGSDLAPSPERQDINSSSDDDRWSNEADNSVIALKPSQIPIERSALPILSHHPHAQLNRKGALRLPEDSYLRDLPAKPYNPHVASKARQQNSSSGSHSSRDKLPTSATPSGNSRSKTPSSSTAAWTCEDEIKPIIMRPADYDAKFNRMLLAEQKQDYQRGSLGRDQFGKLQDTEKYNEINRLLNKKHMRDRDSPERHRYVRKTGELEDFDDSDPSSDNFPPNATSTAAHRKENLTDKQKFSEYTSQKQTKTYAADEKPRYGGRRYVDPADLAFEKPTHNKYAAVHRGTVSPDRSDLGHRTTERQRERQRVAVEPDVAPRRHSRERDHEREHDRGHVRERERYSRSNERNPYREPESIPYIESMEKMMKSTALCYNSFDGAVEAALKAEPISGTSHAKVSQHTKSYSKHDNDRPVHNYSHGSGRPEYAGSAASSSNISPKERFKDAKNKFHAMERSGSRYDLNDDKERFVEHKPRRHGSASDQTPADVARIYDDWSDEERLEDSPPPPPTRSRSRSRDHWEQSVGTARERGRNMPPDKSQIIQAQRECDTRDARERRDYSHDVRARELPGMRADSREMRDPRESKLQREQRDSYRDHRYDHQEVPLRPNEREMSRGSQPRERLDKARDPSRDYMREHPTRREYTPDRRTEHRPVDYVDRSMEKQRVPHPSDKYPPPPPTSGAPIPNAKAISNIPKGYRHSYAEPVFVRSGGRVGLAAVNPF